MDTQPRWRVPGGSDWQPGDTHERGRGQTQHSPRDRSHDAGRQGGRQGTQKNRGDASGPRGRENAPRAGRNAGNFHVRTDQPSRSDSKGRQASSRASSSQVRGSSQPSARPLPADHPLVLEQAELEKTRADRKCHWLAIGLRIGDEWNDPNSFDRRNFKVEEEMADAKLRALAVQVYCAERGMDMPEGPTQTHPRTPERARQYRARKESRSGRAKQSGNGRDDHGWPVESAATDDKMDGKVKRWMKDMGMSVEEPAPDVPMLIGGSDHGLEVESPMQVGAEAETFRQDSPSPEMTVEYIEHLQAAPRRDRPDEQQDATPIAISALQRDMSPSEESIDSLILGHVPRVSPSLPQREEVNPTRENRKAPEGTQSSPVDYNRLLAAIACTSHPENSLGPAPGTQEAPARIKQEEDLMITSDNPCEPSHPMPKRSPNQNLLLIGSSASGFARPSGERQTLERTGGLEFKIAKLLSTAQQPQPRKASGREKAQSSAPVPPNLQSGKNGVSFEFLARMGRDKLLRASGQVQTQGRPPPQQDQQAAKRRSNAAGLEQPSQQKAVRKASQPEKAKIPASFEKIRSTGTLDFDFGPLALIAQEMLLKAPGQKRELEMGRLQKDEQISEPGCDMGALTQAARRGKEVRSEGQENIQDPTTAEPSYDLYALARVAIHREQWNVEVGSSMGRDLPSVGDGEAAPEKIHTAIEESARGESCDLDVGVSEAEVSIKSVRDD